MSRNTFFNSPHKTTLKNEEIQLIYFSKHYSQQNIPHLSLALSLMMDTTSLNNLNNDNGSSSSQMTRRQTRPSQNGISENPFDGSFSFSQFLNIQPPPQAFTRTNRKGRKGRNPPQFCPTSSSSFTNTSSSFFDTNG